MYQGRFQNQMNPKGSRRKTRRLRWGKQFVMLLCVTVLLMGFVGGSLAWLTDTKSVVNNFEYATVTCSATCSSVTNTGNVPAYIRIAIVPINTDGQNLTTGLLTITGGGWDPASGGYYVSAEPVQPGGVLSFKVEGSTSYNVLAEAIQAAPDAARSSWN